MDPKDFGDPLTFNPVPLENQNMHLSSDMLYLNIS